MYFLFLGSLLGPGGRKWTNRTQLAECGHQPGNLSATCLWSTYPGLSGPQRCMVEHMFLDHPAFRALELKDALRQHDFAIFQVRVL